MSKGKKFLIILISVILSVAAAFSAVTLLFQDRFIFKPGKRDDLTEKIAKSGRYERIKIGKYRGWLKKGRTNNTIVYFGGNNEMSSRAFTIYDNLGFFERTPNWNFIMLDYPGYGDTPGKPLEKSIFKEDDALMKYVRSDNSLNGKIVTMGYSLGTASAVYSARHDDVRGVILIAPFDNMKHAMNKRVHVLHGPFALLVKHPFRSDRYARNISAKTIIFASKSDKTVPYTLAKKLNGQFKNAELHVLKKEGHGQIRKTQKVLEKIYDFLGEV